RHTRFKCDWSSDVCSSDLPAAASPPPFCLINGKSENDLHLERDPISYTHTHNTHSLTHTQTTPTYTHTPTHTHTHTHTHTRIYRRNYFSHSLSSSHTHTYMEDTYGKEARTTIVVSDRKRTRLNS